MIKEIDRTLTQHDLIKLKLPAIPKPDKKGLAEEICKQSKAQTISLTSRVLIAYRSNPDTKNLINLD